jgi:Holliday junction resolvase
MGYFGKDLVKRMLEDSGYTVCHYGYEDTLLDYMSKRTSKTSNSSIGRRLRKSPDLLVYDESAVYLVEIKMRTKSPPYLPEEFEMLKEFWKDAILVVIVPEENVFYAQEIDKVEVSYPKNVTLPRASLASFRGIQEIFTKISEDRISYYRNIALQTLRMFMTEEQKARWNSTVAS